MFLSLHILGNFMTCPSKYSPLSQLKYLPIYSIKFCNTVICASVAAFLLSQQKTETSEFSACAKNHLNTENTNGKSINPNVFRKCTYARDTLVFIIFLKSLTDQYNLPSYLLQYINIFTLVLQTISAACYNG